jgi:adenylosuccinate lyase
LVRKGISRDEAYRWVQRNAMRVWENGASFAAEVRRDPDITRLLSPTEIDQLFDARHALRHTDAIFQRVFNKP